MRKYPEVLKCIPPDSHDHYERYKYFMRETRLFDLLENHIVNNLVDYATGVETGLNSNSRKNRGMEVRLFISFAYSRKKSKL